MSILTWILHTQGFAKSSMDFLTFLVSALWTSLGSNSYIRLKLYINFKTLSGSTGGLLGLCLGFSALSLLEIIYYLTIRVCCTSKNRQELGQTFTETLGSAWKKAKQNFARGTWDFENIFDLHLILMTKYVCNYIPICFRRSSKPAQYS